MGKFGKRVNVSANLSDYMIGVMAPSGFGKTTLMYQVCEKEFGPDGYIILDCGQENGVAALQGVVAEKVATWKKMKEVVDDIVKNKETDYPNLRAVVFDTLDAVFESCEQWTVDTYNRENMGKKDFVRATSINGVEGGYGRGLEKCIENVKREVGRLNNAGVGVFWTAHVKEKDQTDLFSGAAYTSLTANMSMKYFNSIKNSSHVIAFGYFDRSIEKQEVGDQNPITKKKKERKAVTDETRKVKFRDDALVADAKCRFSHIVDEIPLDADEFIKAIKDAIEAERNGRPIPKPISKETPKPEPAPVTEEESDDELPFDEEDELNVDSDGAFDVAAAKTEIRNKHKAGTPTQKKAAKALIAATGVSLDEIEDEDTLKEILAVFE